MCNPVALLYLVKQESTISMVEAASRLCVPVKSVCECARLLQWIGYLEVDFEELS